MNRERYRKTGAIAGLLAGWLAMKLLGYVGLMPAAGFGIIGCVMGAMIGEKIHERLG